MCARRNRVAPRRCRKGLPLYRVSRTPRVWMRRQRSSPVAHDLPALLRADEPSPLTGLAPVRFAARNSC